MLDVSAVISFLATNWVGVIMLLVIIGIAFILCRTGNEQLVKNVILELVCIAERTYGSQTGEIKLASVWAGIYERLPWYIRLVFPKSLLESYIENAVQWLKKKLSTDTNLLTYSEENLYELLTNSENSQIDKIHNCELVQEALDKALELIEHARAGDTEALKELFAGSPKKEAASIDKPTETPVVQTQNTEVIIPS